MRRDDGPLGRDQAVRNLARVLVQERDGRHQLANQAERSVDVELQVALVGDAKDVGKARALDVIGNDRESWTGDLHAIDAPDTRVVGVAEVGQPRGTLSQRKLERRHIRHRRAYAENLQQLASRAVGGDHTLAETVTKERGFGPFIRNWYGSHGGPPPVVQPADHG